jgi:hypothetical protein
VRGKEYKSTYRWRELGNDDNRKPDDTLTNGTYPVNWRNSGWKEGAPPAYLVPQEAPQSHQTAMTTQAVETKEHHENQGDIGDKCTNGAESDAVQVEYTVAPLPVPGRAELQIKLLIKIQ